MQVCLSRDDLLLRELNIYETKSWEFKVCELDIEKWKNCGNIPNEQIFIAFTYLFMDFFYFGIKPLKIEHTFKTPD